MMVSASALSVLGCRWLESSECNGFLHGWFLAVI
jgi:hypothetical protein